MSHDYTELVALLRKLSAYGNSDTSLGDDAADAIAALVAERDAAVGDAERLKDTLAACATAMRSSMAYEGDRTNWSHMIDAIDAARQEQKP